MKVKIAYTMDYHQVPELVGCLLEGCREKFSEFSNIKLNPYELEKLSTTIASLREELSVVDSQLQDSLNMMTGYFDAQQQEPDASSLEQALADLPVTNEEG